ncbi:unnamed protein product [Ranitomeya imitator]|uniref:Uncharacterized protein n=1 Tax=Ranitomeya imitator TaxID=111125 RepID=A0ABN9LLS8_9NEOB|nr:unnamed protein product [Ranitomeya imitator]
MLAYLMCFCAMAGMQKTISQAFHCTAIRRIYGSAGEGKIAAAPRADYAAVPAVVMTLDNQAGKVYLIGYQAMLADSDVGASKGGLFDDGKQLSAFDWSPFNAIKRQR